MSTDLLASSADTWTDHADDQPVVDPRLRPPTGATTRERVAAWRVRHHLRRQEADRVYEGSRNPVRGWPVAGDRVVMRFFLDLIRERRRSFVALITLNALAAGAGLVVPALLGDLVDRTVEQEGAGLDGLAVLVIVVVCTQALFTFLAQWNSTLFGQDLLASAREYVVRVILRLPLGQVESASTGDLVTR
ncbi:MAG TPA: ABC transporter ATP-binding protein, partial [Nocardioides sp.]|nr:ABC transporter ATP-binding protein [Nocardioides sp.]